MKKYSAPALLLMLAALWSAGAWLYYNSLQAARQSAERQLLAVARIKANEVLAWQNQRLEDAADLSHNPGLAQDFGRWLAAPQAASLLPLRQRLLELEPRNDLLSAALLDATGKLRISSNVQDEKEENRVHTGDPAASQSAELQAATLAPRLGPLQAPEGGTSPYVDALAPLLVQGQVIGFVRIRSNAQKTLLPMVAHWPLDATSATASLLPRSEPEVDSTVHYLVDAGRARSMSVLLPLGQAPWMLASRIDEGEALEHWLPQGHAIIGLTLVLTVILLAAYQWQRRVRTLNKRLLRVHASLEASEYRFRHLFEANQSVMLLIRPEDGKIVGANEAAARFYGYSVQQLEAMSIDAINTLTPEQVAAERSLAEKEQRTYFQFVHRLASGVRKQVDVYTTPIVDGESKLLFSIIRDMSERERLGLALRAELEKNRAILHNASDGICIMNAQGHAVEVSDAFCKMLGYQREDLLGQHVSLWDAQFNPEQLQAVVEQVLAGHSRVTLETLHRRADGQTFAVEVSASTFQSEDGMLIFTASRDISARKLQEQVLATERRRLSAILLGTNVGTWEWNVQTGEAVFNERWASMLGYRLEDLMPVSIDSWNLLVHPQDLERSDVLLASHFAGELPYYACEMRMRHKDGHWVWVLDSGSVSSRTEDGLPLLMSGTHQDISERKQAELQQRELTQQYTAIFENSPDGYLVIRSADGRIVECNQAAQSLFGCSREALLGKTSLDLSPPLQRDGQASSDAALALSERLQTHGKAELEWTHRRSDGQPLYVDISIASIGYKGEQAFLCALRDIADRLAAEEAVRQSNEMMLAAINTVDEAFVIYDAEDRLSYCNDKYRNVYASTADLIEIGQTFEALVRAGAERGIYLDAVGRIDAFVQERVEAHRSGNQQVITRLDDGRVMRVLDRRLPNGYTVGFRIDITELVENSRRSEQLAKSKSQFLANMSHEIRTPMNAIIGMLTLLEGTELSPRQRDYASKADGAAHGLLALLNDILDFSKVDAGKMELEIQPMRLDALLRNLSVVLASSIRKDTEVLFDIDPALPEVLLGDALRLQQALTNLGGNAVKFTEKGQVVVGLKCLHLSEDSVRIQFTVEDSGIGIPPEQQQRIFTGFSQAEASTTRRFGGTGLGLSISKSLVELMGGTLNLESTPGVGSTFSFQIELPVLQTVPEHLRLAPRPPLPSQTVLIVDDNPIARSLLCKQVQALGWQAEAVASAQDALQRVQQALDEHPGSYPFSLLLVDWQMPGCDGWQACSLLHAQALQAALVPPRCIMLSDNARQDPGHRPADEQQLISGFLVKPLTASMLQDALIDAHSGTGARSISSSGRANRRQLAGMRILVVEDNLINQQVAEELLSTEGATVSLAANGRLGVEAVRNAAPQFDVVLMDLQMPVMDGYGATSAIRHDLGLLRLPIIAMTANAMPGDRETCIAAGMNEHIGKPFDMTELIALLLRCTGMVAPSSEGTSGGAGEPPAHADTAVDALPVIEGLDLAQALARMSGIRPLYQRTARDFLQTLRTLEGELRTQLQKEDQDRVAMILHTLKGNAGTLGLQALAQTARNLEQQCHAGLGQVDWTQALQTLAEVIAQARLLLEQALTALDAAAKSQAVPASADPQAAPGLGMALTQLLALLQAEDMQALQSFAEARSQFEALPENSYEQLDAAMQDLDFEKALQLCQTALALVAGQAEPGLA